MKKLGFQMEISRVFVPRPELKDPCKGPASQHFYSEVVLLEQSHQLQPQLYQLKSAPLTPVDNLERLRAEFIPLQKDSFIQVGEVLHVEMSKKIVYLTDQNLVSYKFMIIVSSQSQIVELSTTLSTLKDAIILDAMNVKDRITISAQDVDSEKKENHARYYHQLPIKKNQQVMEKVVQPCLTGGEEEVGRLSTTSRFCQVKI